MSHKFPFISRHSSYISPFKYPLPSSPSLHFIAHSAALICSVQNLSYSPVSSNLISSFRLHVFLLLLFLTLDLFCSILHYPLSLPSPPSLSTPLPIYKSFPLSYPLYSSHFVSYYLLSYFDWSITYHKWFF